MVVPEGQVGMLGGFGQGGADEEPLVWDDTGAMP